jgi:hypothetical protein
VICFDDNQPCVCAPAEHCCSVTLPSPIAVVSNHRLIIRIMSLTLEIARRASEITRFITSFLRVALRDAVTMFTFATIVSSNAWVRQRKTSSASRTSLAKHAGQKFLTNPDLSGKIRNNRE